MAHHSDLLIATFAVAAMALLCLSSPPSMITTLAHAVSAQNRKKKAAAFQKKQHHQQHDNNANADTAHSPISPSTGGDNSKHEFKATTPKPGDGRRKVFIENDGLEPLIITLPLLADMDIVGVSMSMGDPRLVDSLGQATYIFKNYSMTSCMNLHAGAATPLERTETTFNDWINMFGNFVWKGAWDPDYEQEYNWDELVYDNSTSAAQALVDAVKKYPGELEIYEAGLFTTVAQAIGLWPDMPKYVKTLWVMSGYIDGQYVQVTGAPVENDINTDFNFIWDPEAANIALTSGFPNIYLAGNATNYIFTPQWLDDKLINEFGNLETIHGLPELFAVAAFVLTGNASTPMPGESGVLPLWDQALAGIMAYGDDVIESTLHNVTVGVDTAFNSPFYGQLRIWPAYLAPQKGRVGVAHYINTVDHDLLFNKMFEALSLDWRSYCTEGEPSNFTASGNFTTLAPFPASHNGSPASSLIVQILLSVVILVVSVLM